MDAALTGAVGGTVIGVGIDLVDVERIRGLLARQPRFAAQHFTAAERAWCDRRRDPSERYAARFAAKEAALKALGVGLGAVRLADLEVVTAPSGAPGLVVHGTAAELADGRGVARWQVSLTHTATVAGAVVVAIGHG